jgi:hypothetical protein
MSFLPTSEKFIIFLHPRYFETSLFDSIYKKLKNNLENKGIVVFNIKLAIQELKKNDLDSNKKFKLLFDDIPFPNQNMLYCHLFNGQYYNDSIYIKKKVDIEREMLILLAGKLGVQYITYESEITETEITKLDANVNVKSIKNGVNYNKKIEKKEGIKGKEEYLNRGAPVYLKSNSIQDVEKNIKERMGIMESNVFNYDFYKHNPKLESFVYKRYEFKMLKLEYTIDTEDISDISFIVKSSFIEYGINISFNKSITYNETIKYTLEFFTDKELNKEYFNMQRAFIDKFFTIREQYDCITDKDLAVHYISEYVTNLTKKCYYRIMGGCGKVYNFSNKLTEYINNNPEGTFESVCRNFRSTLQIKNWIYKNLSDISFEILTEDEIINLNNSNQNTDSNDTNKRKVIKSPTINKNNGKSETYDSPIHLTSEQYMANMSQLSNTSDIAMRRSISFDMNDNNNNNNNNLLKSIETIKEETHSENLQVSPQSSEPTVSTESHESENSPKASPKASPMSPSSPISKISKISQQSSIIKTQILALLSEQSSINDTLKTLDDHINEKKKVIDYNNYELYILNEELVKINRNIINKEIIYNGYKDKHNNKFTKIQEKKATELKNILTIEQLRLKELQLKIQKKIEINKLEDETLLLIMEEYDNIITKRTYLDSNYKKMDEEYKKLEEEKRVEEEKNNIIELQNLDKNSNNKFKFIRNLKNNNTNISIEENYV